MKTDSGHWATKQENGSYHAIRLLLLLYRFGGKWLIMISLAPVLAYFFVKDGNARRASLQFLQQLHTFKAGQSPFKQRPGYWLSYQHFWHFALAALAKIDSWLGRIAQDSVVYGGSATFEQIRQSGKGAVLIG